MYKFSFLSQKLFMPFNFPTLFEYGRKIIHPTHLFFLRSLASCENVRCPTVLNLRGFHTQIIKMLQYNATGMKISQLRTHFGLVL